MFDIIIVGDNPANKISAAVLSGRGLRVVYVKRVTEPVRIGFFCENSEKFPVCEYSFDTGEGIFPLMCSELGIDSAQYMEESNADLHMRVGEKDIRCRYDWYSYMKCLKDSFSEEAEMIEQYFRLMDKLADEWMIMIASPSFPEMRKIPNILKYANTKYIDYVEKSFCNADLKKLLCLNMISRESPLVNMAGYFKQMFAAGTLRGGYEHFDSLLESKITTILTVSSEKECRYDYDSESQQFCVGLPGQTITAKALVLSYDYLNKFPNEREAENGVPPDSCSYLNFIVEADGKLALKRVEAILLDDGSVLILAITPHNPLLYIQARIKRAREFTTAAEVLTEAEVSRFGRIISKQPIYHRERERLFSWRESDFDGWDYDAGDLKHNPLYMKNIPRGVFYTGKWGRAFFSGAKVIENNVLNFLGI